MVESYKGPDSPVDFILLGNVLMYVPDKEHEVSRCLQWLKPGGHLLIIGRKCTHADLLLSIYFLPLYHFPFPGNISVFFSHNKSF